jgi:ribosomal protein L30E
MAPTKKSKSTKSTESIPARLALVVKSGKYTLGYKSALKQMRSSKGESRSLAFIHGDWSEMLRRSLVLTIPFLLSFPIYSRSGRLCSALSA